MENREVYEVYEVWEVSEDESTLRNFFETMNGTWIAAPADSSFISRLEYTQSENGFLIIAANTISSKTGQLFAEYEGVLCLQFG